MRTVLIDNYDSFTYNLVHLIAEALGQAPDVFYNDQIGWEELNAGHYDAVVISPGPGHPKREGDFGICTRIVREFEGPVLGVCLGHQGIAHYAGAKVDLAPSPMHGRICTIAHNGKGLFENIPQNIEIVRYHSLLVTDTGPDIEVIAHTPDGLAMALRHRVKPQWGVQFHPESISSQYGIELIRNFRGLAMRHRPQLPNAISAPEAKETAALKPSVRTAKQGRLKLFWHEIATWVDPEACFTQIFAESADAFWLDGTQTAYGMGRYSYLGDGTGPHSEVLTYDVRDRELIVNDHAGPHVENMSIFDYLNARLADRGIHHPIGYQPPFAGGYVGYLGYELKEDCGAAKGPRSDLPDARMIFADRFLAFDNLEKRMWVACLDLPENVERAKGWLNGVMSWLERIREMPTPELKPIAPMVFRPHSARREYGDKIRASKHEIRNGETYEVCLTNEFVAEGNPDPLNAYRVLRRINPAPYASYLKFGTSAIVSCSPERFIKIDHQGVVESKPIKGTAKRGASKEEDAAISEALRTSEKDRSENLMIVDLLRNDLGRVCKLGSVHVPKLFAIETYESVHQLVSTIRGTLRDDMTSVDCIRAAFPGGSMTGAPKIRTMEIIDRLEDRARGVYSGSIGFLSLTGAVDLNIVIRTAVMEDGGVRIGAGGAIVDLSDVEAECDEVWLKCRALLIGLNSLETSVEGWRVPQLVPDSRPAAASASAEFVDTSLLEEVRQEIDQIDSELLMLLSKRFGVTRRAAEFKIRNKLPMMQAGRVRAILDRIAERAESAAVDGQFARDLWRAIIQEACRREIDMRGGPTKTEAGHSKVALLQDAVVGFGRRVIEVADAVATAAVLRDQLGFTILAERCDGGASETATVASAGPVELLLIESDSARMGSAPPQEVILQVKGLGLLGQDLRERGVPLADEWNGNYHLLIASLNNDQLRIAFTEGRLSDTELADERMTAATIAAE
jgi:para-aminobenzoate synthetase